MWTEALQYKSYAVYSLHCSKHKKSLFIMTTNQLHAL